MNSQILPDMLINFALINITDRKNHGSLAAANRGVAEYELSE